MHGPEKGQKTTMRVRRWSRSLATMAQGLLILSVLVSLLTPLLAVSAMPAAAQGAPLPPPLPKNLAISERWSLR